MEGFSVWHWLIIALWLVAVGFPFWRIVGRTGNHPALSILLWVPLVNLIFIWWLAFSRWPVAHD
ncbi:MAG: hypothetical protein M3Z29_05625 [Pseudomonadota bacterium]|nr:hypothetical protein [Pseudomonadota bacterium]